MHRLCLLPVGFLLLCATGCSGDDDDDNPGTTVAGEGIGFDTFVDEYFDANACDGFEGCGDAVQGVYRLESFKICSDPGQFADLEEIEAELDDLCTPGVGLFVELDADFELDFDEGTCHGGGEINGSVRLDISAQCIREAGGGALADACPELSDAVAQVPEFREQGCTISGNQCSCLGEIGVVAEGRCEDFVLESACVMGDTVTFSNADESSEPAIWTFERVKRNMAARVQPVASPEQADPESSAEALLARSETLETPGAALSTVASTADIAEQLRGTMPRLRARLLDSLGR